MASQATAPTSSNMRGMREKVNLGSLAVNLPHAFTLDGDGGIETPGQWGAQYRYMWDRNRISFVDPVIHQLIQAQRACDGDTIKFWRLETRSGNRRGPIQYRVELVNTADAAAYAAQPGDTSGIKDDPVPPPRQAARAAPAITPAPQAAAPAASPREEQATAATASVPATEAAKLSAALVAAVDAAATAESYAEAHSRRVTFTSEDLRAMALTIYIGSQRK
jgi:hypothetical protein